MTGKREEGRGKRGQGRGKRGQGRGKRFWATLLFVTYVGFFLFTYLQQFSVLSSTDINDKTLVVRASCPHNVYLTQSYLL
ncbi:hypothetical protein H6F39_19775 [Anabaena sp. FACHB-1250]|nr:hypothetical protein [Anabaena sp. FACHB-1250]